MAAADTPDNGTPDSTPATPQQMAQLRAISTRAEITPTRFWNEYPYGALRAAPAKLMERSFDAHLYFEVHELLEPAWREADGGEREALQGLIQIAVGYQHAANRNFAGARALLDEGRRRIEGRTLDALELEAFGRGVRHSLDRLLRLDWETVPSFPRQA